MAEERPKKLSYWDTMDIWGCQLVYTFWLLFVMGSLFYWLHWTPVLYDRERLSRIMIMSDTMNAGYLSQKFWNDTERIFAQGEPPERCMTFEARYNATMAEGVEVQGLVSGWYGPGTYLAWWVTAQIAALDSILSPVTKEDHEAGRREHNLDLLASLIYPAITLVDVLARLIRCGVDPGLTAAVFVLLSAAAVAGPAARLSWQSKMGTIYSTESFMDKTCGSEAGPQGVRTLAWEGLFAMCLTMLLSLRGEPYLPSPLFHAVHGLAIVTSAYGAVHAERLFSTFPYRECIYRSPAERAGFFVMGQVVLIAVQIGTLGTMLPVSGLGLSELDQVGALLTTVCIHLFAKRQVIVSACMYLWRVFRMGYRRVRLVTSGEVVVELDAVQVE